MEVKCSIDVDEKPETREEIFECHRNNILRLAREAINRIMLYTINDTYYYGDSTFIREEEKATSFKTAFNKIVKQNKKRIPDFYIKGITLNQDKIVWNNLWIAISNLISLFDLVNKNKNYGSKIYQINVKGEIGGVLTPDEFDEVMSKLLLFFNFQLQTTNQNDSFEILYKNLKSKFTMVKLADDKTLLEYLKNNQLKNNTICINIINYLLNRLELLDISLTSEEYSNNDKEFGFTSPEEVYGFTPPEEVYGFTPPEEVFGFTPLSRGSESNETFGFDKKHPDDEHPDDEHPYNKGYFRGGRKTKTKRTRKNKTKRTRKNKTKRTRKNKTNRTRKNKTKRSRTKRSRTKRSRTKRSRTKRSRTKRSRTKRSRTKRMRR